MTNIMRPHTWADRINRVKLTYGTRCRREKEWIENVMIIQYIAFVTHVSGFNLVFRIKIKII